MGIFNRKNKDKKKDKVNNNFNFSNEVFIALKNKIVSAGYDKDFVYCYNKKSVQILPKDFLFQLKCITYYQSFSEHIENLKERGWQENNIEYIRDGLSFLKQNGLIQSKSEFIKDLINKSNKNETVPKISTLAWISSNHIDELKNSINSYILNQKKFSRSVKYIVFDDTEDREIIKNKQEMLTDISNLNHVDIYYSGKQEKYEFLKELYNSGKNDGLSESLLNFAFFDPYQCNITTGANRNSFLIGTIGEITMSSDDDEICKLVNNSQIENKIQFSSLYDPRDIHIFPDRKTLLKNNDFVDMDILKLHETMLGKKTSAYINENINKSDIDIKNISADFNHLMQSCETQVLATMSGIVGNSGMESQKIVLGLEGEMRNLIIMSKTNYDNAIKSKEMIRITNNNTICESPHLMAGNIGLDNRKLLPPFFPIMRNQDGVFASVLRKVIPGGLIGHIPIAVYHNHSESEKLNPDNIILFSPRISEIINLITNSFRKNTVYNSEEKNFELLGNYFIEKGCLKLDDFNEFLKIEYISQISRYIHYFENLLHRYNHKPDYWANDVIAHIENIENFIKESSIIIPVDLKNNRSENEVNLLCKKLVLEYGKLLTAWPLILEKTVELKKSGKFIFNKL